MSSNVNKKASRQTDIIVSDQFWDSPLYRELVAEVYPIETVYATIEVKGLLDKYPKGRKEKKSDLDRSLEHIATIRNLAEDKTYVRYTAKSKNVQEPEKKIVSRERFRIHLCSVRVHLCVCKERMENPS